MTILITGATGFVGSHILKRLIELDYNIVILKRSYSDIGRIKSLIPRVKSYDIDVVPIQQPFQDQQIDVVIHTATHYGRDTNNVLSIVDTNLMFSLNLLEAAINFNVGIFLNTDTFFNTPKSVYKYLNHYSLSKKQFVEWLKYFSHRIKIVNLKLGHVYGPHDDNLKFVTWITNKMLTNIKNIDLTEGEQKRDFIYIDDVVDVYVLMLEKVKCVQSFSEYDVGTGKQVTLKTFILTIYNEVARIQPLETKLNFGAIKYRDGEFMGIEENVQPLYDLGWIPKYSISQGIEKMVKDIKSD